MKRKKNRFLTFLCSLIPGAGEMYMGLMKMGLSLLTMFMGTVALAVFMDMNELVFVAIIIWIYSFFHANNIAGMPDQDFHELEDVYLPVIAENKHLSQHMQKLVAALLIFFGVILLGQGLIRMMPPFLRDYVSPVFHYIPRMAVAVVLILLGIKMIQGKKEVLEEKQNPGTVPAVTVVGPAAFHPTESERDETTMESNADVVPKATPELPAPDSNLQ